MTWQIVQYFLILPVQYLSQLFFYSGNHTRKIVLPCNYKNSKVKLRTLNLVKKMDLKGRIIVFSIIGCPHCMRAKQTLQEKGLPYTDINVENYPQVREYLRQRTKKTTVPQIFFNNIHVGGNSELQEVVRILIWLWNNIQMSKALQNLTNTANNLCYIVMVICCVGLILIAILYSCVSLQSS